MCVLGLLSNGFRPKNHGTQIIDYPKRSRMSSILSIFLFYFKTTILPILVSSYIILYNSNSFGTLITPN